MPGYTPEIPGEFRGFRVYNPKISLAPNKKLTILTEFPISYFNYRVGSVIYTSREIFRGRD